MDYQRRFNDSLERLTTADGGDAFYARFYERFLQTGDEVAEHFANSDMQAQRRMLRESMAFVVAFGHTRRAGPYLESVASRHGPADLNISAELFDRWLECLLATVAELDPKSDEHVLLSWRVLLAPGLAFMKSRTQPT